jgi:hypothetical protein
MIFLKKKYKVLKKLIIKLEMNWSKSIKKMKAIQIRYILLIIFNKITNSQILNHINHYLSKIKMVRTGLVAHKKQV